MISEGQSTLDSEQARWLWTQCGPNPASSYSLFLRGNNRPFPEKVTTLALDPAQMPLMRRRFRRSRKKMNRPDKSLDQANNSGGAGNKLPA
jgi:hypothetical protein